MYQKVIASIACFIVAMDCADKAIGGQTQFIFPPNAIWMWWVIAACWSLAALSQLRRHRS